MIAVSRLIKYWTFPLLTLPNSKMHHSSGSDFKFHLSSFNHHHFCHLSVLSVGYLLNSSRFGDPSHFLPASPAHSPVVSLVIMILMNVSAGPGGVNRPPLLCC
jgi:hypothetical protein